MSSPGDDDSKKQSIKANKWITIRGKRGDSLTTGSNFVHVVRGDKPAAFECYRQRNIFHPEDLIEHPEGPIRPFAIDPFEEPQEVSHSDDFSSWKSNGREFNFSPRPAAAIKLLYKNYPHSLHETYILAEIDSQGRSKRLRDLFRSGGVYNDAWETLVIRVGKGKFALNPEFVGKK